MFGIEFDKMQLMAVGLNAAGYLAAGGLSVLLYSMLTKRRWRRMFAEIIEQGAAIVASSQADRMSGDAEPVTSASIRTMVEHSERDGVSAQMIPSDAVDTRDTIDEFVSFDNIDQSRQSQIAPQRATAGGNAGQARISGAVSQYRSAVGAGGQRSANGAYTRNRSDVIRLAKEMLAEGRTSESVRRELPINESEMRLVELGSRR